MPSIKSFKQDSKNQNPKNHVEKKDGNHLKNNTEKKASNEKSNNEKVNQEKSIHATEDIKLNQEHKKSEKRRPGREKKIEVVNVDIAVSEQQLNNNQLFENGDNSELNATENVRSESEKSIKDENFKTAAQSEISTDNKSDLPPGESESDFELNLKNKIENENKVEINFPGSEVLRAKLPNTFKVVDKVATDWVHDGRFEELPLKNPLAQYFVAKGLRQAKTIEKKIMNSPTTEKLAMNVFTAALKVQSTVSEVKNKVDQIRKKK